MIDELREIGFTEAKNQIVTIAKQRFKLKTLKNQPIVKWTDVVALYSSPEWYFKDLDHNRYTLYIFQYGIFRNGQNNWLHEAGYNWMHKYKIKYEVIINNEEDEGGRKKKQKKGFVQELLHSKASNSIQDRFMRTCKNNLGQHLLCRSRVSKGKANSSLQIEPLAFFSYSAYLIVDKSHPYNIDCNVLDPKLRLESSIKYALSKGMTRKDIMTFFEAQNDQRGKLCNLFLMVLFNIYLTIIFHNVLKEIGQTIAWNRSISSEGKNIN